jgi:hypothetical protein
MTKTHKIVLVLFIATVVVGYYFVDKNVKKGQLTAAAKV